jgi:hypothetical protein
MLFGKHPEASTLNPGADNPLHRLGVYEPDAKDKQKHEEHTEVKEVFSHFPRTPFQRIRNPRITRLMVNMLVSTPANTSMSSLFPVVVIHSKQNKKEQQHEYNTKPSKHPEAIHNLVESR